MRNHLSLTVARSDRAHARFLAALNRPDRHVLSIRARPAARRFGWLGRDLMEALGIRSELAGGGKYNFDASMLAPVWLHVDGITDLIVSGAEAITEPHLVEMLLVAQAADVGLWLVADHILSAPLVAVLEDWPVEVIDQETFDQQWSPVSGAQPAPVGGLEERWPTALPASDFPTFLTDVRRLLNREDADAVEHAYRAAVDLAATRFASTHITEEEIVSVLKEAMAGAVTLARCVTAVRGVQVAEFAAGWHIQFDEAVFGGSGDHPIVATVADPLTWRRLVAYLPPYRGAVCAMFAAGGDPRLLAGITVDDVTADGTSVQVGGARLQLPAGAERSVRALRLERIFDGAAGDDLLFGWTDDPFHIRRFKIVVAEAARDLGLVFFAGRTIARSETPPKWLRRNGITVSRLSSRAAA